MSNDRLLKGSKDLGQTSTGNNSIRNITNSTRQVLVRSQLHKYERMIYFDYYSLSIFVCTGFWIILAGKPRIDVFELFYCASYYFMNMYVPIFPGSKSRFTHSQSGFWIRVVLLPSSPFPICYDVPMIVPAVSSRQIALASRNRCRVCPLVSFGCTAPVVCHHRLSLTVWYQK